VNRCIREHAKGDLILVRQGYKRRRERENSTLLRAGFEPVGDNLWKREGVMFGREAALQYARRFADDNTQANRQA
jgi:hypothetical protein